MTILCDLPGVKAYLRLVTTTDDSLLTTLIGAASTWIESVLGRPIGVASYTETRDGHGGRRLTFGKAPVSAVASVTVNEQSIPASPGPGQPGYLFTPTAITLNGWRFARGDSNVSIAYTAGWTAVPADIAQACIEVVALRYRQMERIGLVSKGLAGETTAFTQADAPAAVLAVLETYRRRVPL